eukprot:CAMPEP_0197578524 /NCGR_PEP_ID=MMETSP1326-20131121/2692_1 /TAXON_ID=1155430 /ORGANISM="Genus nov. species nov., Strain RCC2288" /LENGTH=474 /DNA_ID=CAMNT_0043141709 /DNA_START=174 /DNA_END=1598 /DNA_ORIENTATION=+
MAPLDAEKRARLTAILSQEQAKSALAQKVVKAQDAEVKMRSMVLSSNDKNMFVSGDKPAAKKIAVPAKPLLKSAVPSKPKHDNTSLHGMPSERAPGPGGATYAASNADSRAGSLYNSTVSKTRDWAVMGAFEAEVFAREQAEREHEKRQQVADQRAYLDFQRQEQLAEKAVAAEEKKAQATAVQADVARYKAEEAHKAEERRAHEAKIKVQREEQLVMIHAERAVVAARKKAEEQEDLAEAQRGLDADKAKKAAKLEKDKKVFQQAMVFNDEQKVVKAAEKKAMAEHEQRISEEYDAMLEAQDSAREQKLIDFRSRIAAKSAKAGEMASEAAGVREKTEFARMTKFSTEREAGLAAKEQREKDARSTATKQQMEMLSLQTRLRDEDKERRKVEMADYFATVREREAALKVEEAAKLSTRRQAAVMNRLELERQMEEKAARKFATHDDVMAEHERLLNHPILAQAKAVVLGDDDM